MMDDPLEQLRAICMSLPEAREVESWGAPTFRVKTIFTMYSATNHHSGEGEPSAWIKSDVATQQALLKLGPDRFYKPPYVGPKGWIGLHLNDGTNWDEVRALVWDAWRASVPKRLAAAHPESPFVDAG
jgi:hypothetical protein